MTRSRQSPPAPARHAASRPMGDDRWLVRFGRVAAVIVGLAVLAAAVPPAVSDADPDSIAEAKEQRAKARKAQLAASLELDLVEAEDQEVVRALEAATELVELQEAKVDAAQQRLDAADDARGTAEIELETVAGDIVVLRDSARRYAVESYVGLSDRRAEAWFDAADATVAVHKVALLDSIGVDTADVLDQLRALEERRDELLDDAEQARRDADETAGQLQVDLAELESRRRVQLDAKAELDKRRARWEQRLADSEQEEADLSAWIKSEEERIQRELEEARAAAAAANGQISAPTGIINANGWTWPTSGGVASGFGLRLHPILGYYRMHTGLDIGGAYGQEIWAANDGVVLSAGVNGGYGNAVIIAHGGDISTLYGHMTSFVVTAGQQVRAGQLIGYVGSTGLSTGPHLHFEVRLYGSPVDPMGYLP